MSFNVVFESSNERNKFAAKIGALASDTTAIEIGDNLFIYAMRQESADITFLGENIRLLVKNSDVSKLTDCVVVEELGTHTAIETNDPVSCYTATGGDVDVLEVGIKLLSELTGTDAQSPDDWARRRLSNRFRPFEEFKTFDVNTTNKPVVFVVDSGINAHTELQQVEIVNFGKTSFCDTYADNLGHGTAVSSCIAGANVGITQNVSLYNYKIFDGTTKPTILELANVLDDIKAFKLSNPSTNVTVNISWTTTYSSYLTQKFVELIDSGCVIVCAAGNSGDDVSNYTPAGMPEVITVGAIDNDDIVAGFTATSVGDSEISSPYGQTLDIFAPGVEVDVAGKNNTYVTTSGTSLSTGFVSAASALIQSVSQNPPSNAEVLNLLVVTSLKGSVLFDRETFSSNQNRIVQLINGDGIPEKSFYIGTFSGSTVKIDSEIASFAFNYTSTLASDSIQYQIAWADVDQQTKYEQFVTFNEQTGLLSIDRPTIELPEGVEFEKVLLSFTKTTNYSTENSRPVFFFVTNSESVPEPITEELSSSELIDVSSNLMLSFKP
jgi:hypothetical protein